MSRYLQCLEMEDGTEVWLIEFDGPDGERKTKAVPDIETANEFLDFLDIMEDVCGEAP